MNSRNPPRMTRKLVQGRSSFSMLKFPKRHLNLNLSPKCLDLQFKISKSDPNLSVHHISLMHKNICSVPALVKLLLLGFTENAAIFWTFSGVGELY